MAKNDVQTKTIGELIDALITTNLRCWFAQEQIVDKSLSEKERLDAAVNAQIQNARRSALILAIDKKLGDAEFSTVEKTYSYGKGLK